MAKKIFIYVIIALVVLGSIFYAGYRTAYISQEKRLTELAESGINIKNQLDVTLGRNKELTRQLEEAGIILSGFNITVGELTEENKRLNIIVGNIGTGINSDIGRLSDLYDGITTYLE